MSSICQTIGKWELKPQLSLTEPQRNLRVLNENPLKSWHCLGSDPPRQNLRTHSGPELVRELFVQPSWYTSSQQIIPSK